MKKAALITLSVILSAATVFFVWLFPFRAKYMKSATSLAAIDARLASISRETFRQNLLWQQVRISEYDLASASEIRQEELRRISSVLESSRVPRCMERSRGNLIRRARIVLTANLATYHCARAVAFSPLGEDDNACNQFDAWDAAAKLKSATKQNTSCHGFASAVKQEIAGIFPAPRPGKPNIIIIVLDAARAADVYNPEISPFINKLAREGLRFDDVLAPSSTTHTSVATLLTGAPPFTHRLIEYGSWENSLMLTRNFRAAGWQTSAFVSNTVVWPNMGFGEGFDRVFRRQWLPAEAVNNDAVAYAAGIMNPAKPQFMYLHYIDAHDPYFPPQLFNFNTKRRAAWKGAVAPGVVREKFNDREIDARGKVSIKQHAEMKMYYDAEISYADAQLEKLFTSLRRFGLLDNSIVVITADHGEEFLEHGGVSHGRTLYDEVLHVPLIVWGNIPKDWRAAHDPKRLASLIDVAPTLLDVAGIKPPPHVSGAHLFKGSPKKFRFSVVYGVAPGSFHRQKLIASVRVKGESLITTMDGKDTEYAPGKSDKPLITSDGLYRLILAWKKETRSASKAKRRPPDRKTLEHLKSLGYVK